MGKKRNPEKSGQTTGNFSSGEERTLPLAEEVLEVGKRTVRTGGTRIAKRVRSREEVIDEPLLAQRVEIERVPINRFVESETPVRERDGTTIVPVFEEMMVVEKRLFLKEELHIRTVSETVRRPQKVRLRSEEVEIEHLDLPEREETPRH